MTEKSDSKFAPTGRASASMFEILDATDGNVVAVRVGHGTHEGYTEFYDLLVEKTETYGTVHVYEETVDWTLATYMSHGRGIIPDLRTGPQFDIGRYAAVGDSCWAKLLYDQWRAIAPLWPVAPDEMRYYGLADRERALAWVSDAERKP